MQLGRVDTNEKRKQHRSGKIRNSDGDMPKWKCSLNSCSQPSACAGAQNPWSIQNPATPPSLGLPLAWAYQGVLPRLLQGLLPEPPPCTLRSPQSCENLLVNQEGHVAIHSKPFLGLPSHSAWKFQFPHSLSKPLTAMSWDHWDHWALAPDLWPLRPSHNTDRDALPVHLCQSPWLLVFLGATLLLRQE